MSIENYMNCAGKKVMNLLFLLFSLLACKPCAAYFLYQEQTFKCPICVFVKNAKRTAVGTCSNVYAISFASVNRSEMVKRVIHVLHSINEHIQKSATAFWQNLVKISYRSETEKLLVYESAFFHKINSVPLYIFLKQLKIDGLMSHLIF